MLPVATHSLEVKAGALRNQKPRQTLQTTRLQHSQTQSQTEKPERRKKTATRHKDECKPTAALALILMLKSPPLVRRLRPVPQQLCCSVSSAYRPTLCWLPSSQTAPPPTRHTTTTYWTKHHTRVRHPSFTTCTAGTAAAPHDDASLHAYLNRCWGRSKSAPVPT